MFAMKLLPHTPGTAKVEISRWKGSAQVEITIQRNQDLRYFNASTRSWLPEPQWNALPALEASGDDYHLILGSDYIDEFVELSTNTVLMAKMRDNTGIMDQARIVLDGSIQSSNASGQTSLKPEPVIPPTVEAPPLTETEEVDEPAVEVIEAPAEPEPAPAPPAKKNNKWIIWVLIILLLLIAGGIAAWWFLSKKAPQTNQTATTSPPPAAAPAAPPASAPAPCDIQANTGDDLNFIQSCLKTHPDTTKILQTIEAAITANKCDLARRLYANQAQSGNAEIAAAYGKAYQTGNSCFQADKETAIYWYQTALDADPNNTQAKEALKELKP